MAIHYRCPKCQVADQASDELAGTQIRCKQCGVLLQLPGSRPSHHVTESPGVPPPAPPAMPPPLDRPAARRRADEDEEYDDAPRRRDRDDDFGLSRGEPPAGWTTASTGLGMMFWTLLAMVIEIVVIAIMLVATGVVIGGQGGFPRGQREESMVMLAVIGSCAFAITALVYFIGKCLCCAVPSHSGARGYALGSVICAVLIVVLYVVLILLATGMAAGGNPMFFVPGRVEGPLIAFMLLIFGLFHTMVILFVVFLKTVARYFGDEGLRRGSSGFLIMYIIAASIHGVVLVLQFTLMARPGFGPGAQNLAPLFMVVGCIFIVVALAAFVWYLVLLAQTRGVIRRSLARPGY